MKIINLTPHPINICNEKGEIIKTIESSGVARLKATTVLTGTINDIPITMTKYSEPEGLPEKKTGVFLIVSQLIKNALPNRDDLLVPAEVVRDEKGNIIGCKSLGI